MSGPRRESIIDPRWRHRRDVVLTEEFKESVRANTADWPEFDKQVVEGLLAGEHKGLLAERLGTKGPHVAGVGRLIGWAPHWRKVETVYKANRKVTLTDEDILKLYTEDRETLVAIGRIAGGVSRERIRQILLRAGHNPDAYREQRQHESELASVERNKEQLAARLERRGTLAKKSEAHYEAWREMWERGKSISGIAREIGSTANAVGTTICRLRAKRGWFPYRRTP